MDPYNHHHHGHATATTTATTTPRPGTPDSDRIESVQRQNPFASPYGSMPASAMGSSTAIQHLPPPTYFHSRRIKKGETEKPWLDRKDPKEKWVTIIPLIGIFLGFALSGFLIFEGLSTVTHHVYCAVLIEDFSSGTLDSKIWTQEVQVGGFGNGEFEETTADGTNVYIQDGMLYIKPTLQDASLIESDSTIDLLTAGTCTSTDFYDCVAVTNTTNSTIVPPTKSGRINTKGGVSIKYGRVEVEAKLPSGDWLWPAIWMLPVNNTYGAWPASGEIDIMESRGNNHTYPQGGDDIISSTLHWGPDPDEDGYYHNNVKKQALHTTYAAGFNTFGIEWSEKYIYSFVNSRLMQVMYVKFNEPFWEKGDFPVEINGTADVNPWSGGTDATPFDQDFYLILNVAVGGTNGWFEDGVQDKPWVDAASDAKLAFWNARDTWYPTWASGGEMIIKSVKMYQQKGYNGC